MALPGQRGQFEKAKHPYAFPSTGGALAFARKSSSFEKVYNAITGIPSDAPAPYAINRCGRFTAKVYSTTPITCLVQVCADPEVGDWTTVATLDMSSPSAQHYSSSNLFSHVRLNVTAVTGTAYVWLLRDYKGDSN